MEKFFEFFMTEAVTYIIHLLEIMGIIVVAIGAFKAFYQYMKGLILKRPNESKLHFLHSMAIALEFKLGAEILKTTLVKDLHEIVILGSIILLRALMSIFIHWEIKQSLSIEAEKKNPD